MSPCGRLPGVVTRSQVWRAAQRGALAEELLLQGAQVRARFDAELVDQQPPHPGVRRERVGLPATAVQRRHERGPQPLAERVLSHQGLELTDELTASTEVDPCGHHVLEETQPELLETGAMGLGPVAEVDEDLAAEQAQPFAGLRHRRGRVTRVPR